MAPPPQALTERADAGMLTRSTRLLDLSSWRNMAWPPSLVVPRCDTTNSAPPQGERVSDRSRRRGSPTMPTLQRRRRGGRADHPLSGHPFDHPLDGRPRSRRQPHSRPPFRQPPRSLRTIATRSLQRARGPPPLAFYRHPDAATRRGQARDTRRCGQLPLRCAHHNSSRSKIGARQQCQPAPRGRARDLRLAQDGRKIAAEQ